MHDTFYQFLLVIKHTITGFFVLRYIYEFKFLKTKHKITGLHCLSSVVVAFTDLSLLCDKSH